MDYIQQFCTNTKNVAIQPRTLDDRTYYLMPCNPFGGYKESGLGREHGKFGFQELTQVKVVSFEK